MNTRFFPLAILRSGICFERLSLVLIDSVQQARGSRVSAEYHLHFRFAHANDHAKWS